MNNTIGILRESLSKKGEKRVAITPNLTKQILEWGHEIIIQPAVHPETREIKRAFPDQSYQQLGVEINEDLSKANVIFGIKEIDIDKILAGKTYVFFSHTHKGQIKNLDMLRTLVEKKSTVIDYELIRTEKNIRLITAFTFNAGYAGTVDTLWALGKRYALKGLPNPFRRLRQAFEEEHLQIAKNSFGIAAQEIETYGTPDKLPSCIVCILGKGKTAHGVREMLDILPHEDIGIHQLKDIYENGSRKKLYVLHIDVEEMYRLKEGSKFTAEYFKNLSVPEQQQLYFNNPNEFETNLDIILPYITVLMNCIVWSKKYPRTVTKNLMKSVYAYHKTLMIIGDISCDPNGSIEFSKETWIDNPIYIYNPETELAVDGFEEEGIGVLAVTNLPCEFSADASEQFSNDLKPIIKNIIRADYKDSFKDSELIPEVERAVIMWKGEFTKPFDYMKKFIT